MFFDNLGTGHTLPAGSRRATWSLGHFARLRRVRCGLGVLNLTLLLLRHLSTGFSNRLGDGLRDQSDRTDRSVVAWNRILYQIGICVRVRDRDDGNTQTLRLANRAHLALHVDDEHRPREAGHVLHARQILVELDPLTIQKKSLLFRIELEGALFLSPFQLLEPADLFPDGLEVREHATKPTLGDIECSALLRFLLDDRSELPFGAHEQDFFARKNDLVHGCFCGDQPVERFTQINDVNPVALREDEFLHLRIPTASLVSEMDASLEKLTQSHLLLLHKTRRLSFLTLRELEPLTCFGATRLLPFDLP